VSRILIAGGDGVIGSALAQAFVLAGHEVLATTRRAGRTGPHWLRLDFAESPASWPDIEVDAAIVCAAQTSVAACEADPVATRLVNATAPAQLIRRLHARGTFVATLSTTLVFDGARPGHAPNDEVSPLTEYGKQKVELERAALDATRGAACVVRLGKVVSRRVPLFREWADALRSGREVRAYDDVLVSPVPLSAVVALLLRVEAARLGGIYHFTASAELPFEGVARALARILAVSEDLVLPERSGKSAAHALLDSSLTAATYAVEIPPPQDAVAAFGDEGPEAEPR